MRIVTPSYFRDYYDYITDGCPDDPDQWRRVPRILFPEDEGSQYVCNSTRSMLFLDDQELVQFYLYICGRQIPLIGVVSHDYESHRGEEWAKPLRGKEAFLRDLFSSWESPAKVMEVLRSIPWLATFEAISRRFELRTLLSSYERFVDYTEGLGALELNVPEGHAARINKVESHRAVDHRKYNSPIFLVIKYDQRRAKFDCPAFSQGRMILVNPHLGSIGVPALFDAQEVSQMIEQYRLSEMVVRDDPDQIKDSRVLRDMKGFNEASFRQTGGSLKKRRRKSNRSAKRQKAQGSP